MQATAHPESHGTGHEGRQKERICARHRHAQAQEFWMPPHTGLCDCNRRRPARFETQPLFRARLSRGAVAVDAL